MIKRQFVFKNSRNVFDRELQRINSIYIHHSGSDVDSIESINNFHFTKFNQGGIVYHFVIDRAGNIFQTRPLHHMTHHTGGHNSKGIGVCALGDYSIKKVPYDIIDRLKKIKESLPPNVVIKNVIAHSEVSATICPGTILDTIKQNYELLK